MKRLLILLTASISLFVLSSCATLMHSTTEEIVLKSQPPNANIIVEGKKFGISP